MLQQIHFAGEPGTKRPMQGDLFDAVSPPISTDMRLCLFWNSQNWAKDGSTQVAKPWSHIQTRSCCCFGSAPWEWVWSSAHPSPVQVRCKTPPAAV